jgi:predicted GNAT family acetyltransferase
MTDTPSTEVRDVPDAHRYEIRLDGAPAGFALYQRRGGRTYFVHTEIDPAFEGKGLGSVLAKGALDAERGRGEPIIPLCPFIRRYIDRHPEYADLVDKDLLARIDGN